MIRCHKQGRWNKQKKERERIARWETQASVRTYTSTNERTWKMNNNKRKSKNRDHQMWRIRICAIFPCSNILLYSFPFFISFGILLSIPPQITLLCSFFFFFLIVSFSSLLHCNNAHTRIPYVKCTISSSLQFLTTTKSYYGPSLN